MDECREGAGSVTELASGRSSNDLEFIMLPVRLTEVVLHTPGSRPLRVLEAYVFHSLQVPQPKICMLLGPGTSGDGNAAEQSATTRRQDTASFMSVAWRVNSGKHQQNRACNRPFSRGGGSTGTSRWTGY